MPILGVSAQTSEPETITIVSDTDTQWNDSGTWLPAIPTWVHPAWPPIEGATWIWNHFIATAEQKEEGDTVIFRRVFTLPEDMTAQGEIAFIADNEITTSFNGTEIGTAICDGTFGEQCIKRFPLEGKKGENILLFKVIQYPAEGSSSSATRNPAGFIFRADFTLDQKEPDPIVLVPGLLASFNKNLLFADQPGGTWDFVPFGNIYEGLIEKFKEEGFVEGQNLFIAHYDWRQPNNESATEYLKPMIEQAKAVTGAQKVDIVAHSMGGLVARSYIQGNEYAGDVDQLITLGTPHKGAADAYIVWEGGKFPQNWEWYMRWYVEQIHTSLLEKKDIEVGPPLSFRQLFPSLQDLLPSEDFIKKDNQLIAVEELFEKNEFIQKLIESQYLLAERDIQLTTIAGTDEATLGTVLVDKSRTQEDELLERWHDGHPIQDPPLLDSIEGDNRVLLTSAHIGTESITLPNITHTELPEAAQKDVLQTLDIVDPDPAKFLYEPPTALVGWIVLSPINLTITAPDGEVLSSNKNDFGSGAIYEKSENPNDPQFIVIKNPPPGEYKITMTGTGEGEYTVVTSYGNEDTFISTERSGITTVGKEESTILKIDDNSFIAPPGDISALFTSLRNTMDVLRKDKDFKQKALNKLYGTTVVLEAIGKNYVHMTEKFGIDDKRVHHIYTKLQQAFDQFMIEYTREVEAGSLHNETVIKIETVVQKLEKAGL